MIAAQQSSSVAALIPELRSVWLLILSRSFVACGGLETLLGGVLRRVIVVVRGGSNFLVF